MAQNVDTFFEHYGVKGMKRKPSPEQLTRVARVAIGTEAKKANIQKGIKAKLKEISDAIKAEEKKKKQYEDALKELDEAKNEESEEDEITDFIKKQATSNLKEFLVEDEPATSNE